MIPTVLQILQSKWQVYSKRSYKLILIVLCNRMLVSKKQWQMALAHNVDI